MTEETEYTSFVIASVAKQSENNLKCHPELVSGSYNALMSDAETSSA
jgi:hypothetical protein